MIKPALKASKEKLRQLVLTQHQSRSKSETTVRQSDAGTKLKEEAKNAAGEQSQLQQHGEVGRVLLNSTILGYSKGIDATCQHFSKLNVFPMAKPRTLRSASPKGPEGPRRPTAALARALRSSESSRKSATHKPGIPETCKDENVTEESCAELQQALLAETREFCSLAAGNSMLLATKLAVARPGWRARRSRDCGGYW